MSNKHAFVESLSFILSTITCSTVYIVNLHLQDRLMSATESIRSLETVSVRVSPPDGLIKRMRLTFDEFFRFGSQLKVKRQNFKGGTKDSSIIEACSAMRSPSRKCRYHFSLTSVEELDKSFRLPIMIEEIDLFSQFWALKKESRYLYSKHKIFTGYQKGHKSEVETHYGGLSEWIQVISGELKVIVNYPTMEHRAKYQSLNSASFTSVVEPCEQVVMTAGNFIVIPGGCIIRKTAKVDTFTLSGQFLHSRNVKSQLEYFEEDLLNANNKYILDRDQEIRYLYWFMTANILTDRALLARLDIQSIVALHESLSRWNSVTVSPDLYKPPGLCTDYILKDMKSVICRGRRKAIEPVTAS